jgi:3-oxoacyl-[acyl-carrier protein] reductase
MTSGFPARDPAAAAPVTLAPAPGARIAVVGGCGGIGRAVVAACRAAGLRVAVLDLPHVLAAEPPPPDVVSFALDATDATAADAAFAALAAHWDGLEGLVHLSGFMTTRTEIARLDPARWDELVDGNLRSAFLVCRAALGLLGSGRDPAIVLVASGLALRVMPGYGGYAAAKAGMIALMKALAVENAPRIRANCVAPGAVETAFLRGGTGRVAAAEQIDRAAYLRSIPLGRIATASDIVGPILFLLGPASGYITGQTLHVNGGGLTP